jgi:hypothetical protein
LKWDEISKLKDAELEKLKEKEKELTKKLPQFLVEYLNTQRSNQRQLITDMSSIYPKMVTYYIAKVTS